MADWEVNSYVYVYVNGGGLVSGRGSEITLSPRGCEETEIVCLEAHTQAYRG